MKTKYLLFITVLLTVVIPPTGFCQNNTQVGLPEWVIARLGKGGINIMRFSPDGTRLAVGTDIGVWLYDAHDGKKTVLFTERVGQVNALAFSQDGKILASGDASKAIKLWDVDTHKERATLLGHKNTISTLTFAPEGKSLYSGCLASSSYDGTIRFWDQHKGKELLTFASGHTESVKSVAFTEDGTEITTVASNGIANVWDLKTKHELFTFADGHCDSADAALSSDASFFARKGCKGLVITHIKHLRSIPLQIWKLPTGEEISGPWEHTEGTNAFTFSPDSNMFVASIRGESIIVWHRDTGVELFRFSTGSPHSGKLTFSPNGKLLATNGPHVKTHVWNITTQRELTPPNMEKHSALAFSPDSTILALGDPEGIVLWNVSPTGIQERGRITNKHRGFSSVLIFSPDGKTLLDSQYSIKKGGGIQLWDTNGNDLGSLFGHTYGITTLVFSHDGKTLASGSGDGTVLLWDWEKFSTKNKPEKN